MAKKKNNKINVKEFEKMKTIELREKHREVFGEETASRNKQYLVKKLTKAIQEQAATAKPPHSKPVRQAKGKAPKLRDPRLPEPGTLLEKNYKGKDYKVKVLENGFEYNGTHFRSLSRIAREITGQVWNGFLFMGLVQRPKKATA
jgi:hypothetical protein